MRFGPLFKSAIILPNPEQWLLGVGTSEFATVARVLQHLLVMENCVRCSCHSVFPDSRCHHVFSAACVGCGTNRAAGTFRNCPRSYPFVSGSILDGDHRRAAPVHDWSTAMLKTADLSPPHEPIPEPLAVQVRRQASLNRPESPQCAFTDAVPVHTDTWWRNNMYGANMSHMRTLTTLTIFVSLLLSAAIFGFFYAWICSTMWGLDAADPRISIQAMQAMNASVRNVVFAPAFFGTPFALALTAFLLFLQRHRTSAIAFALASAVYLCFGLLLTTTINVPMNESLALVTVPDDIDAARIIWDDYSQPWQFWNQTRTVASGAAFLLAVAGVLLLRRDQVYQR